MKHKASLRLLAAPHKTQLTKFGMKTLNEKSTHISTYKTTMACT